MILLGFFSAVILCLGLAKMLAFTNDDNQMTESSEENIPGTPVSTSEEEGYEDESDETQMISETEAKDIRTIIENYEP